MGNGIASKDFCKKTETGKFETLSPATAGRLSRPFYICDPRNSVASRAEPHVNSSGK